jgi:chromosome segregation ATPase
MDLRARIRLAICAADHEEHLTEDDEARIFDAVMPIVAELAADLDNAERDNRRLADEVKRLEARLERARAEYESHERAYDMVCGDLYQALFGTGGGNG